jgi:hypothetical protein
VTEAALAAGPFDINVNIAKVNESITRD